MRDINPHRNKRCDGVSISLRQGAGVEGGGLDANTLQRGNVHVRPPWAGWCLEAGRRRAHTTSSAVW